MLFLEKFNLGFIRGVTDRIIDNWLQVVTTRLIKNSWFDSRSFISSLPLVAFTTFISSGKWIWINLYITFILRLIQVIILVRSSVDTECLRPIYLVDSSRIIVGVSLVRPLIFIGLEVCLLPSIFNHWLVLLILPHSLKVKLIHLKGTIDRYIILVVRAFILLVTIFLYVLILKSLHAKLLHAVSVR